MQRIAILENGIFHEKLLETVMDKTSPNNLYLRHRCLDLFLWVLSVQTSSTQETPQTCVDNLKSRLDQVIICCILSGDRAIAHKTTKIIITALQSFNSLERKREFESKVLSALLKGIDYLASCESAGAMFWFFALLNHVKWSDPWDTANKVFNSYN